MCHDLQVEADRLAESIEEQVKTHMPLLLLPLQHFQTNAINRHFEETITSIDKEHEKLRRLFFSHPSLHHLP
jgi:hypothetical protein